MDVAAFLSLPGNDFLSQRIVRLVSLCKGVERSDEAEVVCYGLLTVVAREEPYEEVDGSLLCRFVNLA